MSFMSYVRSLCNIDVFYVLCWIIVQHRCLMSLDHCACIPFFGYPNMMLGVDTSVDVDTMLGVDVGC